MYKACLIISNTLVHILSNIMYKEVSSNKKPASVPTILRKYHVFQSNIKIRNVRNFLFLHELKNQETQRR